MDKWHGMLISWPKDDWLSNRLVSFSGVYMVFQDFEAVGEENGKWIASLNLVIHFLDGSQKWGKGMASLLIQEHWN